MWENARPRISTFFWRSADLTDSWRSSVPSPSSTPNCPSCRCSKPNSGRPRRDGRPCHCHHARLFCRYVLKAPAGHPRSQPEVRMLSSSGSSLFPQRLPRLLLVAAPALVLMLCSCKQEVAKEAPPPRPVRTVVVEKGGLGQSIVLTGQIQAEKEVALAFRIGGRIVERSVDTGDRVTPDQVVAKLDPQNELNSLRSQRAALSAAQARLEQGSNHFDRQETPLKPGW